MTVANALIAQTVKNHAMSLPSAISNHNPSTLDSSNEVSQIKYTIGPSAQEENTPLSPKKSSTRLHRPYLINRQLSYRKPSRAQFI